MILTIYLIVFTNVAVKSGRTTGVFIGRTTGVFIGRTTGVFIGRTTGYLLGEQQGYLLGEQQEYLLGEQQGYLFVKIIGRNTEKVETFLLTTTGKTFHYTIFYRLEIKLDQYLKSHI